MLQLQYWYFYITLYFETEIKTTIEGNVGDGQRIDRPFCNVFQKKMLM